MSVIVSYVFVLFLKKKTKVYLLLNITEFIRTQKHSQVFGLVPKWAHVCSAEGFVAISFISMSYLQKEVFLFQNNFPMCTINYISLVFRSLASLRMR